MRALSIAHGARTTSGTRPLTCVLLCALLVLASHARAQEPTADQQLVALRDAVEHAHFERAQSDARSLLAREDLRAHQRNDALELLAIAQIAARDDAGAQGTLQELFTRDPAHTPKLRDPGPQVEAAFARAHHAGHAARAVAVATDALRDQHGRTRIEVSLGEGRDAVQTVDVFTEDGEPMHLVAEVGSAPKVALTLPTLDPELLARPEPKLALYVEARAPSGYVLGRDGTHQAPLRIRLDPARDPPARRAWWVWTSVAIVVAGVVVGAAIAAR